jgi:hypothetical protein
MDKKTGAGRVAHINLSSNSTVKNATTMPSAREKKNRHIETVKPLN